MGRFLASLVAAFLGALAAFFFVLLFGAALLLSGDTTPRIASGSVLELELGGRLPEVAPLNPFGSLVGTRPITLRDVTEALEKAAADDRIAAVWLKPDGVAASWATLSEVRAALDAYRASGKPLIASSGAGGFSEAAYYLASAADSVFTPPEAMFELNGFYLAVPFFAGTLDKLGVRPQVIRAGSYKSAAESFTNRELSPENREQYEALLDHTSATFTNAVASARRLSPAAIERIVAEGGLYDARAALDAGLVDALRYDAEVIDGLRTYTGQDAGDELRTVELKTYVAVPRSEAGLRTRSRNDRIAVIYAVGQIVPGESKPDAGSGALLGSDTFAETIREAVRDETVRAIVVRIDSPGGSAAASDAMWQAMEEAREVVPVVASMGSVAASGGYYTAVAADTIVAEPNTITGSIGVISILFDASEFLNDKLGITLDAVQTGPAADLGSIAEPLDAQGEAILERMTEQVYTTFLARVAAGRGFSPDSARTLAEGRVYTGTHAQQLGLVDELGTLDRALEIAAEMASLEAGAYQLRVLPSEKSFFELLTSGSLAQATLHAWHDHRSTDGERVLRRQVSVLREAADLHARPQARLPFDIEIR